MQKVTKKEIREAIREAKQDLKGLEVMLKKFDLNSKQDITKIVWLIYGITLSGKLVDVDHKLRKIHEEMSRTDLAVATPSSK